MQTETSHSQDSARPSSVSQKPEFDKYYYYMESVQSPETDAEFLSDTYKGIRGNTPSILREDFCGTFAVCCEWAKLNNENVAHGVDIDMEPVDYGSKNYLVNLSSEQQSRVRIAEGNVLSSDLQKADVSCSLNFSYFCFKDREVLKQYFKKTFESLNENGIHVMDCFGGGKCQEANEEETVDEDLNYSYFWDQDSFNPINHHAQFYIHFQQKGQKRQEKVFSYDWRMWSLPELRDILMEVGYKNVGFYWEGTDSDGDGDGEFTRTEDPQEECEAWVAYIVAEK